MARALRRILAILTVAAAVMAVQVSSAQAGVWGVAGWFWYQQGCLSSGAVGYERGYWSAYYCYYDPSHAPARSGPWKLVVHYR